MVIGYWGEKLIRVKEILECWDAGMLGCWKGRRYLLMVNGYSGKQRREGRPASGRIGFALSLEEGTQAQNTPRLKRGCEIFDVFNKHFFVCIYTFKEFFLFVGEFRIIFCLY